MIVLLLLLNNQVHSAVISIWPVKLSLWPDKKMDAIHLINKGDKAVNVQIYAKTWDMDENGKFIEMDTGHFVFFPRLTTLEPNEDKAIRVGYNSDAFPNLEKSYRLYVEELPPIKQPTQAEHEKTAFGFQTILKLSVPLFVIPTEERPEPQLEITEARKDKNGLQLGIHNMGTHHFQFSKVSVKLFDVSDNSIFSKDIETFQRVLPKRYLFFDIPLKDVLCDKAKTIEFTIYLDEQKKKIPKISRFSTQHGCVLLIQ